MSFEVQIRTVLQSIKYIESFALPILCTIHPSIHPYFFSLLYVTINHSTNTIANTKNYLRCSLTASVYVCCAFQFKHSLSLSSFCAFYINNFHCLCICATCFPATIFTLFTTFMCSVITRLASVLKVYKTLLECTSNSIF